ncbi:T9SS type A sorting domain-containing protein [Pontibacter sp. G13]|uniref:T9SS type A sorting domain-containing protein n=1 Tax=Pontibacter sp. G13 TaxID=3074898 RepID=UPI00288C6277|nr:T9SS type A sorting domain-containing protein [Pontibacter sp. G13]WNJ18276.1 T9SS type A sorting domain-containing protein [Pontibacter sp. G13]
MKRFLILSSLLFALTKIQAQCLIPNGDFEHWVDSTRNTVYNGEVTYSLPTYGWTESGYSNIVPRFTTGAGFFYKYEGDDVDGAALYLKRGTEEGPRTSQNHGFMIVECTDLPKSLVGTYKFSGSSEATVEDYLIIGAFAYKAEDYPQDDLDPHASQVANEAFSWMAYLPTDSLQDFEIDLSVFEGQEIDRIMIQFVMLADYVMFLETPDYATAVIDDVAFTYETVSIDPREELADWVVYPNPTSRVAYIDTEQEITEIAVFDMLGKRVMTQKNSSEVDLGHLANGVYVLSIRTVDHQIFSTKILKE